MKLAKGHSNFQLELIQKPEGYFVKKVAYGKDILRLIKQKEKQVYFKRCLLGTKIMNLFDIPEVIEENLENESQFYYFIMKFYNGNSILDILEKGDITLLDDLIEKLFNFIDWELNECKIIKEDVSPQIRMKLLEIKDKIEDLTVIKIIDKTLKLTDKPIYAPIGLCHGDFTLANLIFTNKIILLDFLDSYVNSPLQDVAKLLQSINLQWELLMSREKRDLIKIKIGYDYLKKRIKERFKEDIFYLITLLRLFPYITDNNIYKIVLKETQKTLKEIL